MSTKKKKPKLGRGLSSLMTQPVSVSPDPNWQQPQTHLEAKADVPRETLQTEFIDSGTKEDSTQPEVQNTPDNQHGLQLLSVQSIQPNPYQPRQTFLPGTLEKLAESIAKQGLMQPIVVQPPKQEGGLHLLIAGERRWRAAQIAGIEQIPAFVKEVDDQTAAELALIENVQREDLNAMDRAEAFHRLQQTFGSTHDQIAEQVGVDRSTITNLIRLLKLAPECRQMVRDGLLNMGQARALASLQDGPMQVSLAQRIVRDNLSVRQVEQLVKKAQTGELDQEAKPKNPSGKSAHVQDLEKQIAEQLGTKVSIKAGRKKNTGSLTIQYFDGEQFEAICERLSISFSTD